VDQWDWEVRINKEQKNLQFLKETGMHKSIFRHDRGTQVVMDNFATNFISFSECAQNLFIHVRTVKNSVRESHWFEKKWNEKNQKYSSSVHRHILGMRVDMGTILYLIPAVTCLFLLPE
jgi:asparagine synthetase A